MTVERLTEPGAWLGEGPIWDVPRGELLWVDILNKRIHRTNPTSGVTQTLKTPTEVGAVALTADGSLLAALVDGVYQENGESWERVAAFDHGGHDLRSNDGKVDPQGRFVVGTMPWDGDTPTGSLYRVAADGAVETLLDGLSISNGLVWVGERMWHIDSPTKRITEYHYQPAGAPRPTGRVIEVSPPGGPDGMTIDVEGCLWVAIWGGSRVRRYSPDGDVLAEILLPASRVSSCAFGGSDMSTLFITTATKDLADPTLEPDAGAVFMADVGTSGELPYRFG